MSTQDHDTPDLFDPANAPQPPNAVPPRLTFLAAASRLVALCLFATGTTGAALADDSVFVGTLAGKPIVASLEYSKDDGEVTQGRYFYRSVGRDIILEQNEAHELQECSSQENACGENPAHWEARVQGDTLVGKWIGPGGKQWPLQLQRAEIQMDGRNDVTFTRLRLANAKYKVVETRKVGPLTFEFREESLSGVCMPRVKSGLPMAIRDNVNADLLRRFELDIDSALTQSDFRSANEVIYADRQYLVVGDDSSGYGRGAAHPWFTYVATTYDLSTGDPIDFSQRFRFTKDNAPIDLARRDVLDAVVLRSAMAEAADERRNGEPNGCMNLLVDAFGCKTSRCAGKHVLDNMSIRNEMTIHPVDGGVYVMIDAFPESERSCRASGNGITLGWQEVRRALLPKSEWPKP